MKKFILIYIICRCIAGNASAQTLSDFLTAARSGNPTAQFNAAQCYRYGWGTAPNTTEWQHYMRLAAEGGLAEAQVVLAEHCHALVPEMAAYWRGESPSGADYHYHSFEDGCYYGELLGGARDGYGTFVWDDGTLYRGEWEDGERNGMGMTHFNDQDTYGNYIDGQMEGYGAIVIASDGCWLDGAEGSTRYVGYFQDGLPSGVGTLYDASGEVTYYGNFKAGIPTSPYPTTAPYTRYRWHHEVLPNGDSWEGESYDGVRQGWGIYRWADGSWWCGYWNDGLRDGEGLFVRSDGAMMRGTWEKGELKAEN